MVIKLGFKPPEICYKLTHCMGRLINSLRIIRNHSSLVNLVYELWCMSHSGNCSFRYYLQWSLKKVKTLQLWLWIRIIRILWSQLPIDSWSSSLILRWVKTDNCCRILRWLLRWNVKFCPKWCSRAIMLKI